MTMEQSTSPLPLAATSRQPVPGFITTGAWRQCAPDGGVMLLVPAPTPRSPDLLRWAAMANAAFAIPEGFFIGPYAAGGVWAVLDGRGVIAANGREIAVEHPGAYPLIEHERHTEGVLELDVGSGVVCYAVCFTPGVAGR